MIGKLETVVLEARDPRALAEFYAAVLGLPITRAEDAWVAIGDAASTRISFQRAPGRRRRAVASGCTRTRPGIRSA